MKGTPAVHRVAHHGEALAIIIGSCLLVAGFFVWQPFLWIVATLSISIASYLRWQAVRKEDRVLREK